MEEINIREFISYCFSKILYICAIVLSICFLGVFYFTVLQKPIYESSTSLILTGFSNANKENEAVINTNDLNINQKLLATYQEITKSKKVLEKVIHELHLDYTIEEFSKHVYVKGVPNTEIIKIVVHDCDAEVAYYIVKRIAEVFSQEVKSIYNVSNVSILDTPSIATRSSNIGFPKVLLRSLGLGILISFLVIFVAYYFDTTIKNVSQIETKLKVPVLGSIPDYNKKGKKKKKGIKLWMN